ncbi:hypothetical protein L7F22_065074 [Adiantum nelumboides]|nr:hypothetical protein [Adiantum nelumboides]
MALLQPFPPSQSTGNKKPELAKAQPQEQVAETPVLQAVPVQPATCQQPIVGPNGQGSDLQATQQVFPPPSVHPGYFGGGSVFQSMAGHALGNQFYTPGTVFGGAQMMMPNPMYGGIGLQPGFQSIHGQFGMPHASFGMAGTANQQPYMTSPGQFNSGQGTQINPNSVPMFESLPYDNLTPLEKPTPYKEGGKDLEVSQHRGVQFSFVANDRVLIKGNKRTPERFVGQKAIITTQCLNGWYLVKTLDTGESVRLQYRSLLKLGDKETTTEVSHEQLTDENCNCEGLERPISACHRSLSAYNKECFLPNSINRIDANSSLCGAAKGLESLDRTNENRRSEKGTQGRVIDTFGASWHIGHTSSSSSQELQGGQVHVKRTQETATLYYSADEDQRAIKRSAAIGAMGGVIEGSTLQSNCSLREHNATQCKKGEAENGRAEMKAFREAEAGLAGKFFPGYRSLGLKSQGKRPRPKHTSSQLHKGSLCGSNHQEADPYKKVYMSGCCRATKNASSCWLMDNDHCSALLVEECQEANAKTSGESSSYPNAVSFCETLKRKILDLETEIPWSCMQNSWKEDQAVWLDMLQKSSTLRDVAKRLEEFRKALILENAGNMTDNNWNKELEAAVEQEAVEAVDTLWRRLHDDISKLMVSKCKRDRKPLNCMEAEFLELKNHFPQLCIRGLSHVGVIAATSMAAAEAYAVGDQDIETLLTIPIKLVQENNIRDLRAVIDAIEREKRHLSAKVLDLCSGGRNYGCKSKAADPLVENPSQVPVSPNFLALESEKLLKTDLANESTVGTKDARCIVYDKELVLVDADTQDKDVVPTAETGGEETDLSDSD